MTPQTIQLFMTPVAGVLARRRAAALRRALEARGARVIVTEGGFAPLRIEPGADHVCAIGGDGTLRYVVDAVRASHAPVSVSAYRAGTINLTALEYGYPKDPRAFVRRLLDGAPSARHIAVVNDLPVLACASVGPDSYAVAAVSPALKAWLGRFAYILAFFRILVRWRRPKIVLHHGGGKTECEAVYIAKGPFFAGRWSFARDARGSERLLHVVALRSASRAQFLLFVWAIATRRVDRLSGVVRFTCDDLAIDADTAAPLQGDGDIIAHLPASLRIDPETLSFA